jgi:uncharacterized protein
MQNPVRWFEIYVADMKRAKAFYESVFKIKLTQMPFGDGEMWGFPADPHSGGCSGSLVQIKGLIPSGVSTIVYFASEDCGIEEKEVPKYSGKIHKSKFAIGQYGFITLAIDTEGNMFGIHSMKKGLPAPAKTL